MNVARKIERKEEPKRKGCRKKEDDKKEQKKYYDLFNILNWLLMKYIRLQ